MRFGRLILLASLAPLIGLPAATAILSAAGGPEAKERAHVSVAAPSPEFAATVVSSERTSRQAVLALAILADTPLAHSLWMVEQAAVALVPSRTSLRLQLRC
jgi:hypothetical protein